MATFVRIFAQKVTAELCPLQALVEQSRYAARIHILNHTFLGCFSF
jgi:hypothetical protein